MSAGVGTRTTDGKLRATSNGAGMSDIASSLLPPCVRTADTVRPVFGQVEAVAPHLRIEKLPMDIQQPRRFGPIAGRSLQGAANQHLLQPRQSGREILIRPRHGFRPRLGLFEKREILFSAYLATHKD